MHASKLQLRHAPPHSTLLIVHAYSFRAAHTIRRPQRTGTEPVLHNWRRPAAKQACRHRMAPPRAWNAARAAESASAPTQSPTTAARRATRPATPAPTGACLHWLRPTGPRHLRHAIGTAGWPTSQPCRCRPACARRKCRPWAPASARPRRSCMQSSRRWRSRQRHARSRPRPAAPGRSALVSPWQLPAAARPRRKAAAAAHGTRLRATAPLLVWHPQAAEPRVRMRFALFVVLSYSSFLCRIVVEKHCVAMARPLSHVAHFWATPALCSLGKLQSSSGYCRAQLIALKTYIMGSCCTSGLGKDLSMRFFVCARRRAF